MTREFLQELPWALPLGTPSGKGLYLTIYPLSPNTDTEYNRLHLRWVKALRKVLDKKSSAF